jgi:hypothetical protein
MGVVGAIRALASRHGRLLAQTREGTFRFNESQGTFELLGEPVAESAVEFGAESGAAANALPLRADTERPPFRVEGNEESGLYVVGSTGRAAIAATRGASCVHVAWEPRGACSVHWALPSDSRGVTYFIRSVVGEACNLEGPTHGVPTQQVAGPEVADRVAAWAREIFAGARIVAELRQRELAVPTGDDAPRVDALLWDGTRLWAAGPFGLLGLVSAAAPGPKEGDRTVTTERSS